MRVGIVGGGVVGKATARTYLEHCDEVRVYDRNPERATHTLEEVLKCDLVFLCLPTPQKDGLREADVSVIESVLAPLAQSRAHLVLRSTVPVGTTDRLRGEYRLPNLVHSPEFLTARCANVDALIPARNVIGAPPENACRRALTELYRTRFPGTPIYQLSCRESELVKLVCNGFFAVKVAYFNEVYSYADALGMNWSEGEHSVYAAVLADGRISPAHTQVPGPDGRYGYGGACLPKDVNNLIACMDKDEEKDGNTVEPVMLRAADTRNRHLDRPDVPTLPTYEF